jgi:ribonuclease P protein component
MNERLTPRERIRSEKDFTSLYKSGSRYRGRYFNVVYRPNSFGYSRLGVVVSKKVGSAVTRNGVKRRIRSLFRRNKGLLAEPMDLIVVTRKEILELSRAEMRAGYLQALELINKKWTSQ